MRIRTLILHVTVLRGILDNKSRYRTLDETKVETLQSEIATEVSFILCARWYCRHVAHAIHFRKHISIFPAY